MAISRRVLSAAIATTPFARPALAQSAGPIKIVWPFTAGAGGDVVSRFLAEEMRKALGELVIVEDRAGADGRIGTRSVATAPPDGRTLLVTANGPVTIQPSLYPNLPYQPLRDLMPVTQIGTLEFALSTGKMTGAQDLRELVDWMRANPEKASFASPGVGTIPHLLGVQFSAAAQLDLRHAPYRGTAPALTDLLAGHIPLASTTAADFGEHHRAGSIRMLATSGAKRSPYTPDVPTYREQGYDIEAEGWFAAFAPAGTPAAIVERYANILIDAVRSTAGRQVLAGFHLTPTGTSPAEMQRIMAADYARWAGLIKSAGIKPED